jgi:hypothetical protein
MRKSLVLVLALAVVVGGYFALANHTAVAVGAAKGYSGTVYVAGEGGHFAKMDVSIDPSSADPISVKGLDRIVVGSSKDHPVHDARIDAKDRNTMYWSTIGPDPDKNVHAGKIDLATGKVTKDVALPIDARGQKWTGAIYCGSGQTKSSFLPVTMTVEAYIDVFDKATMEHKARVFLDKIGYPAGSYLFFHGTNTPDGKKFVVAINLTNADGKMNGNIDLVMLDIAALEKGKVKKLATGRLTGSPGETITFRQTFTPDGKYLLQAGGDRFFVVDAKSLKLVKEVMLDEGQNHDIMPTPDGKYAIYTLRSPSGKQDAEGKNIIDGTISLYDLQAQKKLGKPVSACLGCHEKMGLSGSVGLCGLDANLK